MLHIGNARTALLNALFARREGGTFVLRFDDTDLERSQREFAEAIERDLAWLGIPPDVDRAPVGAVRALRRRGRAAARRRSRLYPCYETPDELEFRRKRQLARGLPPIYDRAALKLSDEDRPAARGGGPPAALALPARPPRRWPGTTSCAAHRHVDCASLSDPVLVREDGTYLYTLPSVVDDVDLDDHARRSAARTTSPTPPCRSRSSRRSARRRRSSGTTTCSTTASGEGLSKRLGHLSLSGLREAGLEPQAVASLAVLVGSAEAVRPVADLDELARLVDFAHISRAPAKFDEHELEHLNARLVHEMPLRGRARSACAALGIGGGEAFWLAVRTNLTKVADAAAVVARRRAAR